MTIYTNGMNYFIKVTFQALYHLLVAVFKGRKAPVLLPTCARTAFWLDQQGWIWKHQCNNLWGFSKFGVQWEKEQCLYSAPKTICLILSWSAYLPQGRWKVLFSVLKRWMGHAEYDIYVRAIYISKAMIKTSKQVATKPQMSWDMGMIYRQFLYFFPDLVQFRQHFMH